MRSWILMKLSIRMNTSARLRLAYGIAEVLMAAVIAGGLFYGNTTLADKIGEKAPILCR